MKNIPWALLLRYPGTWTYHRRRHPDQPGVVVLQQLGAQLPVLEVPCEPDGAGAAAGGDLPDDRCRLDRRRLAVRPADQGSASAYSPHGSWRCWPAPAARCRCSWRRWSTSIWVSVLLIGLAMAAHQGFSANLFTLVSDTMPKSAVAGAVGLGGCISSILGGLSAAVVGRVLDATHNNYTLVFFACAGAYVVATGAVHFLLPKRRSELINAMSPA